MQTNYEVAYGRAVPAFRKEVALAMRSRYHMTQTEIAKRLGITQAAVSKYLGMPKDKSNGYGGIVDAFIKASLSGNEKAAREALCKACQADVKFICAFVVKT